MKAKEYAARLAGAKNFGDELLEVLLELIDTTVATAGTRATTPSMLSCIRESFTKWKSIVSQTKALNANLVLEDSLFPTIFGRANPPLFAVALENNVFLGFTPDADDVSVAQMGRAQVENVLLKERLASLQKQAAQLGIAV